jgi:hypothetical protein
MNSFKEMENGTVFLIMPSNASTVPLFCPLCKFPMQTQDDSLSFKELGCCYFCDLEYRSQILQDRLVEHNQLEQDHSQLPQTVVFKIQASPKWNDYLKTRRFRSKRTIILK